ncbi:helix-turn-helix domain-containing protein [Paenimyroides aestuarii]|uniref:Helix-turn-helix domain-containing protein n=1 Tax=Paenimyroides aestuarii TaxID=2968490 RepID=A0ABY5NUP0_9FLAO|nr:helix-turn-helix domain-containing protein [Paenimyroides aestuarii]UUV22312.1 helix-turn-helix domain-containing protein [Paenimyroides aestuarii]
MDKKIQNRSIVPNYKKIYVDLLEKKYPHKKNDCAAFLSKEKLTSMDVLLLNDLIFGKKIKEQQDINQKYKSYDAASIEKILNYQKKHNLNDSELALHFKLSRNTVAKWKKIFQQQTAER